MEEEKKDKKRGTPEEKQGEIEKALVAAGTALLIVGFKHALASLFEQWRALVFLLLNLILLSILFTSKRSNLANHKGNKSIQADKKKRKRRCKWSAPVEELHDYFRSEDVITFGEPRDDDDGYSGLSKEELNAKVEAFIVMFRQQLALDAQVKSRCFGSHGSN